MQVDSITYINPTGRSDERTVYTVVASVACPWTLICAVNRRRLVVIRMAPTAERDVESVPSDPRDGQLRRRVGAHVELPAVVIPGAATVLPSTAFSSARVVVGPGGPVAPA